MKICTKCKRAYPATLEFFKPRKRYKNGLGSWCRNCERKNNNKWVERNRKQHNANTRRWYETIRGHLIAIYGAIKDRCNNPMNSSYYNYGGRRIKNKFQSTEHFINYVLQELQIDPRGLDIDRIDNNGHYAPNNIRFVTRKINLANRRNSKFGGKRNDHKPTKNSTNSRNAQNR